LQWDEGSLGVSWADLAGFSTASTASTFTVTTGITSGSDYQFRVRAKNIHGWGEFSSILTIQAAGTPS